MRVDLTLMQLDAIKRDLADQFTDDERGWLDLIEGETDALEIVKKLLDGIEADEGDDAVLALQIAARQARSKRCNARIAARRQSIMAIMQSAGLKKLPLPEATLSLGSTKAKLAINDTAAVPAEYGDTIVKPSMDKIKAAFPLDGPLPNWLRVDDARPSLTIRRV